MNWGEIQLASVRKMFLNTKAISVDDLDSMKKDKKFLTYLDAMPDAANEGIRILVTRGKPLINQERLMLDDATDMFEIDGYYCFILPDILTNYLEIDEVYVNGVAYKSYTIRDNKYLYIREDVADNNEIVVAYKSYPTKITQDTLYEQEITLPVDMINILPLYIASELYKDDDISLSTYYRNQFETELENMRRERTDKSFTSVKGWL